MVWQPPQEIEQKRQYRRRAIVVWGIFGLLVMAALGVSAGVRRAGRVPLDEPIAAGELSARVPAGWDVSRDLKPPRIVARGEAEGRALVLSVVLRRADEPISGLQYAAMISGGEVLDEPRRVKLGAGQGHLIVYEKRFLAGERLIGGPVIATAVVGSVGVEGEGILHVELERFGAWDPSDAVLVQQVAESVRVRPSEALQRGD
jgi:hypothetical protein